jgi:hypothetical protein
MKGPEVLVASVDALSFGLFRVEEKFEIQVSDKGGNIVAVGAGYC